MSRFLSLNIRIPPPPRPGSWEAVIFDVKFKPKQGGSKQSKQADTWVRPTVKTKSGQETNIPYITALAFYALLRLKGGLSIPARTLKLLDLDFSLGNTKF